MANIAIIRLKVSANGLNQPIHIFGSLDPISTPLYFLSGADLFDGLTWLRYAYKDGLAIYQQNYCATDLGIRVKTPQMNTHVNQKNFLYLTELQTEMELYLETGDFDNFKHHGDLFRTADKELRNCLGGKNGW